MPHYPTLSFDDFSNLLDGLCCWREIKVFRKNNFLQLQHDCKLFNSINHNSKTLFSIATPQDVATNEYLTNSILLLASLDYPDENIISQLQQREQTSLWIGLDYEALIRWLVTTVSSHLQPLQYKHGTLMNIWGKGVLLTGPAGIGKSSAAYELLKNYHQLVADDAPMFYALSPDKVIGKAVPHLKGLLEIRGLGIIDIKQRFGAQAITNSVSLDMIIQLKHQHTVFTEYPNDLLVSYTKILQVPVKSITIPLALNTNITMLVESAVNILFNHPVRQRRCEVCD